MTNKSAAKKLNHAIRKPIQLFKPPEKLTVSQWADKYRVLSAESSAEPGLWRTKRTPYLEAIMDSFTDYRIKKIALAGTSQIGKSELLLNMIGYTIHQDPGSTLFIQPTLEDARKFSRLRIAPMIRDSKALRNKVSDVKSKDSGNTILQKSYPGGMLTMTGSNSASALASTPVRYVFKDEQDRWAISAGTEGDPGELAEARTKTFYNSKSVGVSSPTVKGASKIEEEYNEGTQERWCHLCPECGEQSEIVFDNIRFEFETAKIKGKKQYKLTKAPEWACPKCGCQNAEATMRKQPAEWIAENPDALEKGIRSFWLNAFSSPWTSWTEIVLKFLEAKDNPMKLQVVYNTLLGQLWEDRGEIADEDTLLARREEYGQNPDSTPVELPEGVLVLTCGVDTQDNRLEYEVVGHGRFGENWGIEKGFIPGRPDTEEVWQQLDAVTDRVYRFRSGQGLRVSVTFVDSGGHFTQEVYEACRKRLNKRVFAIKGKGGEGVPYLSPPTRAEIQEPGQERQRKNTKRKKKTCALYVLGVDAGKERIMNALQVQEAGPNYCHFPLDESRGYDSLYFNGLLSEKMTLVQTKKGQRWGWERIPGHAHNEALDCRNYAIAAFRMQKVNFDIIEERLRQSTQAKPSQSQQKPQRRPETTARQRQSPELMQDDW